MPSPATCTRSRRREVVRALAVAGAAASSLGVAEALGSEQENAHLEFAAEGPCQNRATFVAQVAARTARATWVDRAQGVRSFDVRLEADPVQTDRWSQAVGTLTIRDTDGSTSTRRVEGDSCDDVLAALALVTALAIDPQAKVDGVALPVGPLPAPAPAPGTTQPLPGPVLAPPAGWGPAAPPQQPVPTASPPPPPGWRPPHGDVAPAARWRWAAGVLPHGASGLGSALSFVMPIYVDFAEEGAGLWSPSFRLALSYLPKRTLAHGPGTAEFIRLAAHASACPLRVALHRTLGLRPCAGAEVGMLRGSGEVPAGRAEASLWLAAVVPVRLEWIPLDWALLELQGEFGVPFIRHRFYFEPDETVLTVDPVFGTVGGGVGVRFP